MMAKRETQVFNVLSLYQAGSILFLIFVFFYSIGVAEELTGPFLTGPMIAWTHFFTLGVIAPLFFGYALYALLENYSLERLNQGMILFHFSLYYISLCAFLWNIFTREGDLPLLISAIGLFLSVVIFLKIFAGTLFSRLKEARGRLEFWVDLLSAFYLFQTILFGLVLAINLFYPVLVSSLYHSIKLHSHSGIAGFFFLQWFNQFRRQMLRKSTESYTEKPLFAWVLFVSVSTGLTLWTSVHDKFEPFFHLFFAGVLLAVVSLVVYIVQNRFYRTDGFKLFIVPLFFLIAGLVTGSDLIYSPQREYLEERSMFFLYGFFLFFGFYALSNVGFLYDLVSLYFPETVDHIAESSLSRKMLFLGGASLFFVAAIWMGRVLWVRLSLVLLLVLLLGLYARFYSIYRPYMRREL